MVAVAAHELVEIEALARHLPEVDGEPRLLEPAVAADQAPLETRTPGPLGELGDLVVRALADEAREAVGAHDGFEARGGLGEDFPGPLRRRCRAEDNRAPPGLGVPPQPPQAPCQKAHRDRHPRGNHRVATPRRVARRLRASCAQELVLESVSRRTRHPVADHRSQDVDVRGQAPIEDRDEALARGRRHRQLRALEHPEVDE